VILTFYSFKGGVGRTQALANIGVVLAEAGHSVLTIDFDLEAPGLSHYYQNAFRGQRIKQAPGLLDLLLQARESEAAWDWRGYTTRLQLPGAGRLDLITSGIQNDRYAANLLAFDWRHFFEECGGGETMDRLRSEWTDAYDFVLVDSRTGITDAGGICTIQLPDVLVPVFTANEQSLYGATDVVRRAQKARMRLARAPGPALVFPLPSRIDDRTEIELAESWMAKFAKELEEFYEPWVPEEHSARQVLDRTKLPYVSYYSFGESLPVLRDSRSDFGSLGFALRSAATLIGQSFEDVSEFLAGSVIVGAPNASNSARNTPSLPEEAAPIKFAYPDDEFRSGAATAGTVAAPSPHREAGRRSQIGRRRLLKFGVAAGVVGAASAGGLWYAAVAPSRVSLPVTRNEQFDLVTVGPRGEAAPRQQANVDVFDLPIGRTALEFSVIPGGGFLIGSPDSEPERRPNEGPQKSITVPTFALGRTAVTQAQWADLVTTAPSPISQALPRAPSFFRGDDLPVETVSWEQATEFCKRLSMATGLTIRLPSEAEWEYACRAFTTSAFHFGPTVTPELANYCGTGGAVCGMDGSKDISSPVYGGVVYDSGSYADGPVGVFNGRTTTVRSYPPNRFGLFEMHGNVWEHCLDSGPVDYRQIPNDGTPYIGPQGTRVARGGAWSFNPAICRSAYRDGLSSDFVGWQGRVGFRVVCALSQEVGQQG
jgi:formylglycine-generating enzyme required for sulfatase activity/MinD-like ATPase involved in chromosome partitioning or flagellar assembly